MKNNNIVIIILVLVFSLSGMRPVKGESRPPFTVENFVGAVYVKNKSGKEKVFVGQQISRGDTIITKKRSLVDLVKGSSSIVRIKEKSVVKIQSLIGRRQRESVFFLLNGSLHVTMSRLRKGTSFQVRTPTTVASVRGTTFSVTSEEDKSTTEVLSGEVILNPVLDGTVVKDIIQVLKQNQGASIVRHEVRDIIKKRSIEIKALNAARLNELREELRSIKAEIIDMMGPEHRREIRLNILRMKKEFFEKLEKEREKRLEEFNEWQKKQINELKSTILKNIEDPKRRKKMRELLEKADKRRKKRWKALREFFQDDKEQKKK